MLLDNLSDDTPSNAKSKILYQLHNRGTELPDIDSWVFRALKSAFGTGPIILDSDEIEVLKGIGAGWNATYPPGKWINEDSPIDILIDEIRRHGEIRILLFILREEVDSVD